jgi:hypothetical protein
VLGGVLRRKRGGSAHKQRPPPGRCGPRPGHARARDIASGRMWPDRGSRRQRPTVVSPGMHNTELALIVPHRPGAARLTISTAPHDSGARSGQGRCMVRSRLTHRDSPISPEMRKRCRSQPGRMASARSADCTPRVRGSRMAFAYPRRLARPWRRCNRVRGRPALPALGGRRECEQVCGECVGCVSGARGWASAR